MIVFHDIFLFCVQNNDCEYTLELPWWGGSNKYPHSMFWIKNKKSKPHFHDIKVGCKGVFFHRHVYLIYCVYIYIEITEESEPPDIAPDFLKSEEETAEEQDTETKEAIDSLQGNIIWTKIKLPFMSLDVLFKRLNQTIFKC